MDSNISNGQLKEVAGGVALPLPENFLSVGVISQQFIKGLNDLNLNFGATVNHYRGNYYERVVGVDFLAKDIALLVNVIVVDVAW